jgi:hypothetical protein
MRGGDGKYIIIRKDENGKDYPNDTPKVFDNYFDFEKVYTPMYDNDRSSYDIHIKEDNGDFIYTVQKKNFGQQ